MTQTLDTRANPAFVAMMALMTSIIALSTDIMLPAMPAIAAALDVANVNDVHLVLTILFLGIALGQPIAGPLSDRFGRKPVILIAFGLFFIGGTMATFAQSFEVMIIGRLIQGLGISGPRVVSMAIIRDLYKGRTMARILSLISMFFILVPAVAPTLGQAVQYVAGWRAVFAILLVVGAISCAWYMIQQGETLAEENRRPFSVRSVFAGYLSVFRIRPAIGYTLALGFLFGPFLGYLSTAQKIFQDVYDLGAMFPVAFAVASLAIGAASLVNSRLVERLGMDVLCRFAFTLSICATLIAFLVMQFTPYTLSLFMPWMLIVFFCQGILWGNMNALAMEPLGHLAGIGAAVVGSVSTLLAIPIASVIAASFDGSVVPYMVGTLGGTVLAIGSFAWARRS